MKEATGETSMTMVTIVAIGVIAAILAFLWPQIQNWITEEFNNTMNQGHYDPTTGTTVPSSD